MAPDEKREHCVSVRLNDAELATLDRGRVAHKMQRGEFMRCAALHQLPPVIPPINREAWAKLARLAANFNQLQHAINAGHAASIPADVLEGLRSVLIDVRAELIGIDVSSGVDDES